MKTYAELMEASGKLSRAAHYLLKEHGGVEAVAMGILMGLAYVVRPQRVAVA